LIDERAVVAREARVHEGAWVGPYAVIGPDVEIGSGTRIEAHVVVRGPTVIGADNRIFQFSSIGDDPQDKKYSGEPTRLVIGDRNTIREYCTINRGTVQDQGVTRVGNDNLIMAYSHIAHDCVVGDGTVFANNATIAGHVQIGDHAILGGFTAVHQYCRIGPHAFTAIFSCLTKDVPAYVMISGNPAEPRGINSEGLRRRGFTTEQIRHIRDAYSTVYRRGLSLQDAIAEIASRVDEQPELAAFLDSLRGTTRGLTR
jgi:UDP-N-acetylglucosamine acyltransferase